MKLHNIAFYAAIFFIVGIFIASIVSGTIYKIIILSLASLIAGYFLRKNKLHIYIAIFVIIGGVYYVAYDDIQKSDNLYFGQTELTGIVRRVEAHDDGQRIFIDNIKIYAPNYPEYEYGNELKVSGDLRALDSRLADYFLKDGILGTISYPEIRLIGKNNGNFIIANLLNVKNKIIDIFVNALPYDQAIFMAGLTLGEKASFDKSFRDEMSRSGTSHLVALSGYNIAILVENLLPLLTAMLGVSGAFWSVIGLVGLFVLMTGAEASIVRAACMGGIMLLAGMAGRIYSVRNAITIVALCMLVYNPKLLAFDIGFQLSFLALLGIIYLPPIFDKLFNLEKDAGFMNWRKNLKTTMAAQLAVTPIILKSFGVVSLSGIVSNVLILPFIPYTMLGGFLTAILGFVSDYLARVFAILPGLLINYEFRIIKFFAGFGYAEGMELSWFGVIIYYSVIALIIYYYNNTNDEAAE